MTQQERIDKILKGSPQCKNTHSVHPNWYGDKYGGYCLECSNAGVDELEDEIANLKAHAAAEVAAAVSEKDKEIERLRNDLAAEIKACAKWRKLYEESTP